MIPEDQLATFLSMPTLCLSRNSLNGEVTSSQGVPGQRRQRIWSISEKQSKSWTQSRLSSADEVQDRCELWRNYVPFAVRVGVVDQEASLTVGLGKLAANRNRVGLCGLLRLCTFFFSSVVSLKYL
jgi:hypothetical protein